MNDDLTFDPVAAKKYDEARPVDEQGLPMLPSALSWYLAAKLVTQQTKRQRPRT